MATHLGWSLSHKLRSSSGAAAATKEEASAALGEFLGSVRRFAERVVFFVGEGMEEVSDRVSAFVDRVKEVSSTRRVGEDKTVIPVGFVVGKRPLQEPA